MEVDPEREVTVTCGATEAHGRGLPRADQIPVTEVISGAVLRELWSGRHPRRRPAVFVPLDPPSWTLNATGCARHFSRDRARSS